MSAAPVAPTRAVRVVTVAAVLLVAVVAAVVSYSHMQELAAEAGEGWRSYLLPLSVDGLMVAAGLALLTRRRAGLPGGALAWAALVGGAAASVAANVLAAQHTTTARLVAAWAPVALVVAFELLLQQRRAPVDGPVGGPVGDDPPTGHPVDDGPPAGHPVVDEPGDDGTGPVDEPGEDAAPMGAVDPLSARLAELVGAARAEGRPLGRRTVARELQVTEYRAGQLLARSGNGTGGAR